jgi:hypothetical protein
MVELQLKKTNPKPRFRSSELSYLTSCIEGEDRVLSETPKISSDEEESHKLTDEKLPQVPTFIICDPS